MTVTKPGKLIDSRFRISGFIGSGGFGSVHQALDEQLAREVAVKVLDSFDPNDTVSDERFRREAKVMSQLQHENIVQIYSYGREESGRPYFAMQLLHGQTLAQLLQKNEKLPWRQCLHIFKQVAQGLGVAHAAGVVHRDLKPANIMLLDEPEPSTVKILDFGLSAILFDSAEKLQRLTQTGNVVGTAFYMSPEVALGQQADPRSDIYSMGCVLYEALAGHPPYTSNDGLDLLYSHVHDTPQRLDPALGLPEGLERVVFKAMQKSPGDRFQTMAEFEHALKMVIEGKGHRVTFESLVLPARSRKRSGLVLPAVAGIALAIVLAVIVVPRMTPGEHTQVAPLWQQQFEKAQKEFEARHYIAAWEWYERALKLTSRGADRASTEIAMGRYANIPEIISMYSYPLQPLLTDAVANANGTAQRAEARCYLGICQFQNKDYDGAYATLVGEPWKLLDQKQTYLLNHSAGTTRLCIAALGQAAALCSKPNYELAEKLLTSVPRFEETQRVSTIPRDLILARIYLKKPEMRQEGISILESIAPFVALSNTTDREFIRTTLGGARFDQLMCDEELRAESQLAKTSRLGSLRHALYADGATNVYRGMIGENDTSPLMMALHFKYEMAAARTADEIERLLDTPPATGSDERAEDIVRTCEGVGYADLNQADNAINKLASHPWSEVDVEHLPAEARNAAAEALAKAYLGSAASSNPREALDLLSKFIRAGDDDPHVLFLQGVALLESGDKAGARAYLGRITPYRYNEINREELAFLKTILKKHSMMDLWKP